VKTTNATVTPVMSAGYTAGMIVTGPIKIAKQHIAIAIERSWPSDRMVATIPEAMPRCLACAELMMALVFGDEKRPYPRPSTIRLATITKSGVAGVRKIKKESPRAVRAIPVVATTRGSMRSESLPATGEKMVWTTGWATRMRPAVPAEKPAMYWR
jgi:hypothetical protein